MVAKRDRQRERTAQAGQDRLDRLFGRGTVFDLFGDQVCDHLAIRIAFERAASGNQFVAQRLEVLDDPVVHQRDVIGRMRVGIVRSRRAVSCPAGVGDSDGTGRRMFGQFAHEVGELALRAPTDHLTIRKRAHARAVVAPVLHPPEPVDEPIGDLILADDADNSAHDSKAFVKGHREPGCPACLPGSP